MDKSVKKELKEAYSRLKKVMEKIINPNKTGSVSQLVLQPIRNKPDAGDKNN
jgi:hypothetical protein